MNLDNNNHNKDTSSNDVFSIFTEKNLELNISLLFHMDYLIYKKDLIKNLFNDLTYIINFYNNETSDILLNIMILKKKNKIDNDEFKIFLPIFELLELINKLNYIDQEEFIFILLKFFSVYSSIILMDVFFKNFKFKDVLFLNVLIDGIKNSHLELSKNNIIYKTFNLLSDKNNVIMSDIIINQIKFFAKFLCNDYFMYYNSSNIYNIILKNLLYVQEINSKNNYVNTNQILIQTFKKYKKIFMNEYDFYYVKYLDIYSLCESELNIKFKLKNNIEHINKIVENIDIIKNFD